MTPNLSPIVQATAAAHPDLLADNTSASCCAFVQHVLAASGDPEWGHVGKTQGEAQYTPSGFVARFERGADNIMYLITGVSTDAIFHRPSHQIVDILGNATANDLGPGHGSAVTQWNLIPAEHMRPNNPWIAAVPITGTPTPPHPPESQPYPDEHSWWSWYESEVAGRYAAVGRTFPDGSEAFRWFSRCGYDIGHGMTKDDAAAKHLAELSKELGL